MSRLTSCKGLLMLLTETDLDVVKFALDRLGSVVDEFWYELSSQLVLIEELHDSADLPQPVKEQAALVASKVYFHLGEYDDSIHFALAAGTLFTSKDRSLYTDTILGKCIDRYIAQRKQASEDSGVEVDKRLETLFCNLAADWQAEDDHFLNVKELVGLMIAASRLDLLEGILAKHIAATKSASMLTFTLQAVNVHVSDITFRQKVILSLTKLYSDGLESVDYFSMTQCYIFLADAASLAKMIYTVLEKGEKLLAYQLGFDLFDHASQELLQLVSAELKTLTAASDKKDDSTLHMLGQIMNGTVTTQLFVKFLYSQCKADIHILNNIKKSLDPRNSITHSATLMANALTYAGTTIDGFLRDNLEWVGRANNWAKFTATASVGVIHRGHIDQTMSILKPYLPNGPVGPLPFQEAGALYGLGLIQAPVGAAPDSEVMTYLTNAMRTHSSSEPMMHGAALGLGLAGMGSHSEELFDTLFACISGCDAVAGEGASIAIGLLMMGSGNKQQAEILLNHAKEDQKEKTIRGLSMAIGLLMMGQEAKSDEFVDMMLESSDPWVRVGGCYTIGLGYAGTGNYKAVERLLQIAVRDVSDEVKRSAVSQIGFLTFLDPKLCVDMTRILADSYNAHIRYGVAMAVGVAAAGTGNAEAITLLKNLMTDVVDFVRQGAIIALSMVMIQLTEKECEEVKTFKETITSKINDRKEDTCTKFGCILAAGILDAGGRNCTIALHKQRHPLKKSIAGLFLFTQYWYWFPLTLMLSMALTPTCVIGLNHAMLMPKYQFSSNAPPSRFSPAKSVLVEKKGQKEKTKVGAVLSTTAKVSEYRQKRKTEKEGGSKPSSPNQPKTEDLPKADEKKEESKEEEEKAKEEEATSEVLNNPARVTMSQLSVLSHDLDDRYRPLKPNPIGVVMLEDRKPDEPVEEVNITREDVDAVKPPAPFEWP